MKKLWILGLVMIFLSAYSVASAAPVDVPTAVQGLKSKVFESKDLGLALSVGAEGDFVNERELDESDGEAEFNAWGGKIILSLIDRFDLYTTLGQVVDPEYKAKILGSDVIFELEDKFFWSVGLNALLYEQKDWGVKLFADAKFRSVKDMAYEALIIDGTKYTKSQLAGLELDAKWKEWQVALGVAKQLANYFIPYGGIKFSGVEASAKATYSGTTYDLGSADADKVVGLFVGCAITPFESFSIDLQGRFIDETAFSVRGTFKF